MSSSPATSYNSTTPKIIAFILITSYLLGFSIYSGYTADHNKPDNDSSGLFIASYIICILECIIYVYYLFRVVPMILFDNSTNNNNNNNNNYEFCNIIPFGLNIYWLVIYFNYTVSEKYDEYALVKTVEFFTIIGLVIIVMCVICGIVGKSVYPASLENSNTPTHDPYKSGSSEKNSIV